jgi:hypothetical protein
VSGLSQHQGQCTTVARSLWTRIVWSPTVFIYLNIYICLTSRLYLKKAS